MILYPSSLSRWMEASWRKLYSTGCVATLHALCKETTTNERPRFVCLTQGAVIAKCESKNDLSGCLLLLRVVMSIL